MQDPAQLLLAFYGDDFTGSTDALDFLSRAGVKTVLFIAPPIPDQLAKYPGLQAFGIAGMTRSMKPAEMEEKLRPAFTALRDLKPRHIHYKVCSTFDSSPTIGSIGKAIDLGAEIIPNLFIPLLVAAPMLGRYCAFGNLFARMGIGSQGSIYRLDRHPSMSKHPMTPAHESDLRLHLSLQTGKQLGLMDLNEVVLSEDEADLALKSKIESGAEVVLFDAIYPSQMSAIGRLIDQVATDRDPLFSVGSSGIEMALGAYWKEQGLLSENLAWKDLDATTPLLIISGSCSPTTAGQIEWAIENGFAGIALDTETIALGDSVKESLMRQAAEAILLFKEGKNVIIHASLGANDKRVNRTIEIFARLGLDISKTGELYGSALGEIAREIAANTSIKRIVIAGGDTSGFAAQAMGVISLSMIASVVPGAPLCRADAPGSPVDGLELNFKGGQVGDLDYFGLFCARK